MRPVVGITACSEIVNGVDSQCVGDKYVRSIAVAADCVPVLIPSLGEALDIHALLERLDGLLATGSDSGVHPRHYGGDAARQPPDGLDPSRDATTLPLLGAAVEKGVPVLAICRGHQELNVALGGTLHQFVHELADKRDHRENPALPKKERYEPVHTVHLAPGGFLATLLERGNMQVNSLHWQGIDRLASPLVADAWADDGLIEATHVADAPGFAVSVQWHPEWRADENPHSVALFEAFAKACQRRAAERWHCSGSE